MPDEFVVIPDIHRRGFYWVLYHGGICVDEPRVSVPGAISNLPAASPVPDSPARLRHLDTAVLATRWVDLPLVDGEPLYLWAVDATVSRAHKPTLPRLRVPQWSSALPCPSTPPRWPD